MAIGIPKSITNLYNRANIPHSWERKIASLYYRYLRIYLKIWTWWNYNRKNSASIDPFKVIWIDPAEITLRKANDSQMFREHKIKPAIKDGDWDQKNIEYFEETEPFQSIQQRFEKGQSWNETRIQDNESREKIERLYENIKAKGFKTQSEIKPFNDPVHGIKHVDRFLNEINEIMVTIDRNGEIIFDDGNHRLSIAKILGLEKIPVRVLVRHEKWQEKRNKAVEKPETLDEKFRDHPDIEYLLD